MKKFLSLLVACLCMIPAMAQIVIDNCDDGDTFTEFGGVWTSFDDSKDREGASDHGASSVVSPVQMDVLGSGYAAYMTFTLGSNFVPEGPGVGTGQEYPPHVGVTMFVADTVGGQKPMDFSGSTGISFYYSGPPFLFAVNVNELSSNNTSSFGCAKTEWFYGEMVTINWEDFSNRFLC